MLVVVRQGDKYGPECVDILRRQAKHFCDMDTLVLGDGEDADIPLLYDFPGWWAKLELFRPDIPKPFIYIDLDSFILGDITPLLGETMICREWHPNIKGCGKVQSSLIAINEYREDIWQSFIEAPDMWMNRFRGDQNFLERFEWDFIQDKYPGLVGSYKMHNRDKRITDVVTFHGKPKQWVADGWAKEVWEQWTH